MSTDIDLFCGRTDELDILKAAWLQAKAGVPQIVSIVAESGFGKTRLAQEFFNWLSSTEDESGEDGYWPDQLLRVADNLQVNPPPDECSTKEMALPFLWWGLRLTDPTSRNHVGTSALRASEEILKSHLHAYSRTVKIHELRQAQAVSSGLSGSDLALNFAGSLIPGGPLVLALLSGGKTVLQGGAELGRMEMDIAAVKRDYRNAGQALATQTNDLVDMITADLRRIAHAPPLLMSKAPVVILIDDFQWVRNDPTVVSLLKKLTAAVKTENWPFLLLVTCWEQEWRLEGEAGVRQYIDDTALHTTTILLPKLEGLESLINLAFRGLPHSQVNLIIEKADGNPRFLREVLAYLRRTPKLFIDRNQNGPLTSHAETQIKAETFEDLVRQRLQGTPTYVQAALGIASLQGLRFSSRIVSEVATSLALQNVGEGLTESENPYAFTSRIAIDGAEFRARVYQDIAKANLANITDVETAEAVLRDTLSKSQQTSGTSIADSSDDVLEAQTALFDSSEQSQRDTAFLALAELARRALATYDYLAAGELAKTWASQWRSGVNANSNTRDMLSVYKALVDINDYENAEAISRSLLNNADRKLTDSPTEALQREKAISLTHLCNSIRNRGDTATSIDYGNQAIAVLKPLYSSDAEVGIQQEYFNALYAVGASLEAQNGLADALEIFKDALTVAEAIPETGTPKDRLTRRNIGIALQRIGDILTHTADPADALPLLQRSLELHTALWTETGDDVSRRDQSVLEICLGRSFAKTGDLAAAAQHMETAFSMRLARHEQRQTPAARTDLNEVITRCLEVYLQQGNTEKAIQMHNERLDLNDRYFPDNDFTAKRMVFLSHYNLGVSLKGNSVAKLAHFKSALAVAERIKSHTDTIRSHAELGTAHRMLAATYLSRLNVFKALFHYWHFFALVMKAGTALGDRDWTPQQIKVAFANFAIPDLPITIASEPPPAKSKAPSNATPEIDAILPLAQAQDATDEGLPQSVELQMQSELDVPPTNDAVAPEDWSHLPRNALCPCGSTLRVKHCHGKLV